MARTVLELLIRHGAPVLFFAQVFGIVGLPIPDELLLTAAGALALKGQLSLVWVLVAAIAGCLSGITLSYTLGRRIGLPVLRAWLHVRPEPLARAQRWFEDYGGWVLALGYFVPGVRHVSAIAAGSACLNFSCFARYAYPGGVLWCLVFLGAGYYAGDHWREVAPFTRGHWTTIALLAIGAALLVFLIRVVIRRRQEDRVA
jgi:membrane protein DedA with SNARE-associated domain